MCAIETCNMYFLYTRACQKLNHKVFFCISSYGEACVQTMLRQSPLILLILFNYYYTWVYIAMLVTAQAVWEAVQPVVQRVGTVVCGLAELPTRLGRAPLVLQRSTNCLSLPSKTAYPPPVRKQLVPVSFYQLFVLGFSSFILFKPLSVCYIIYILLYIISSSDSMFLVKMQAFSELFTKVQFQVQEPYTG